MIIGLGATPALAQDRGEHRGERGQAEHSQAEHSQPAPAEAPKSQTPQVGGRFGRGNLGVPAAPSAQPAPQAQRDQGPSNDNRARGFTQVRPDNGDRRDDFARRGPGFDNRGRDFAMRGPGGRPDFDRFHRNFTAPRRFHINVYQRPRGWYSHRWVYGEILPSLFWASEFWLTDYYDFGLEPPPPGTVWVRDGDDAILIDRFSGEIIEVAYNVFY
jgi:Ni/Co efflux regulator RcnB